MDVHLVIGGMRSGKSRHAVVLAQDAERRGLRIAPVATALPADGDMRERIQRHRADRPAHWQVIEVDSSERALGDVVRSRAAADACLLIDCTTVWLSQLICPPQGTPAVDAAAACQHLLKVIDESPGRAIIVGNEIGLGVIPVDAHTRKVVDALGRLHQALAERAVHVTWMVVGLPVSVKGGGL